MEGAFLPEMLSWGLVLNIHQGYHLITESLACAYSGLCGGQCAALCHLKLVPVMESCICGMATEFTNLQNVVHLLAGEPGFKPSLVGSPRSYDLPLLLQLPPQSIVETIS